MKVRQLRVVEIADFSSPGRERILASSHARRAPLLESCHLGRKSKQDHLQIWSGRLYTELHPAPPPCAGILQARSREQGKHASVRGESREGWCGGVRRRGGCLEPVHVCPELVLSVSATLEQGRRTSNLHMTVDSSRRSNDVALRSQPCRTAGETYRSGADGLAFARATGLDLAQSLFVGDEHDGRLGTGPVSARDMAGTRTPLGASGSWAS